MEHQMKLVRRGFFKVQVWISEKKRKAVARVVEVLVGADLHSDYKQDARIARKWMQVLPEYAPVCMARCHANDLWDEKFGLNMAVNRAIKAHAKVAVAYHFELFKKVARSMVRMARASFRGPLLPYNKIDVGMLRLRGVTRVQVGPEEWESQFQVPRHVAKSPVVKRMSSDPAVNLQQLEHMKFNLVNGSTLEIMPSQGGEMQSVIDVEEPLQIP